MEIVYVEKTIPINLKSNTLYISKLYSVAIHLCPCGCERESVTPLDSQWQISGEGQNVSLTPSILNKWCKSHYWIKNSNFIKC